MILRSEVIATSLGLFGSGLFALFFPRIDCLLSPGVNAAWCFVELALVRCSVMLRVLLTTKNSTTVIFLRDTVLPEVRLRLRLRIVSK